MELLRKEDMDTLTVDSVFERIKALHTERNQGLNEYRVGEVKLPMDALETTPDILSPSGGERLRRFGVIFGITAIPDYSESMSSHTMLPRIEERLLDSDNIEDLRERIHQTVDLALDIEDLRAQDPAKGEELVKRLQEFFKAGLPS